MRSRPDGYTVAMERPLYASYLMSALIVLLEPTDALRKNGRRCEEEL